MAASLLLCSRAAASSGLMLGSSQAVTSQALFSTSPVAEGYKLRSRSAAKKRYRCKTGGTRLVHGLEGGKEIRTTQSTRKMFARVLPLFGESK